ncbi:hypothetical protein N8T08_008530 [Aspergillus melleus]|uniref:Uncharacterized protein n=1 Tax=Aspergillus melleus TaxID=138277 RepID=A0ACC3BDJ1_9EURO|nr:hypothetical protein N8T08_008530 [Aspergillus melleus]
MASRLCNASRIGRLPRTTLPRSTSTFHTSSLHHHQHQQTTQFYLPHESAPHAATILGFPSRQSVSKAFHPGTCREIVDLAATIAEFEPVRLYTRPEDIASAQELIKQRVHRHPAGTSQSLGLHHDGQNNQENGNSTPVPDLQSRVQIIPCPTNHCWVRDTGPVFVRPVDTDTDLNSTTPTTTTTTTTTQQQQQRFAIDFSFCEWGNKHLDPTFTPLPEDTDDPNTSWPIPSPTTLAENTNFAARVIASFSLSPSTTNPITTTRITTPLRLEGGGIEVDGQGTFFAMESSIFCSQRNPSLTRAMAEKELSRLLGVRKFIWFPGRKGLDVTDAHVDALVRVVRPGVVVVSRPWGYCGHDSLGDEEETTSSTATSASGELSRGRTRREWKRNYSEILTILSRETDALGRRFEVHEIEEPDPRYLATQRQDTTAAAAAAAAPVSEEVEEEDPAASYVNFYFVNGAVVMPVFGDPEADERAVRTMRRLLPEREVRAVRVNCLPRMGGVVHCVTQQVPAL